MPYQELISLLELVSGNSNEVNYLFSGNEDTLTKIKDLLQKNKGTAFKDTRKLLKEIAVTREKHNEEAQELLSTFLMALSLRMPFAKAMKT